MSAQLEKIIEEVSDWLQIDGVEGVGQGEHAGKPCITVLVSKAPEHFSGIIPKDYKGYPVILQESGTIEAL